MVPVAVMRAAIPYVCRTLPVREDPHAETALAVSLDLMKSSRELATWARW